MFESARLKLTLFYLAILLFFSLVLTLGFKALVQNDFNQANDVQRGAFHRIGLEYFENLNPSNADGTDNSNNSIQTPSTDPMQPDQNFAKAQKAQAQKTQNRLTREALFLNIGVFVVGAAISYWYAGRTLRPIEEAHERQKRFTSDASHELRTPLASMRLENEIFLRQKKFLDGEVREQIGSNLEEVARLERLTTSLLELNRYETTTLTKQSISTYGVADDAIKQMEHAVYAAGITFENKAINAKVLAERESLVQLLAVVLDNAAKYGPADGTVELAGALHGNEYVFTVRDHGTGISEKDLPHVFERMYRGDKARNNGRPGHGIGLSLAQQIATANGATLTAGNHPEGGAIFRVSLPKA